MSEVCIRVQAGRVSEQVSSLDNSLLGSEGLQSMRGEQGGQVRDDG